MGHYCKSLAKISNESNNELLFSNITNPNSIYINGKIFYKGYKLINLHFYVDTGASLCLASKYVIPDELWENTPREISVTIANEDTISIHWTQDKAKLHSEDKQAKRNYRSNEKELLVVKNAISKFSIYLTLVKSIGRTNNKIFTYFLKTRMAQENKQGHLDRWQIRFYNYSFKYRIS